MTRNELMQDSTEYCCYCGTPKVSVGCCGENHFETFAQMSSEDQDDFLQYEDEDELQREWVGLTDEEVSKIIDAEIGFNSCWGPEEDFARAIEAKLKEKNT